MLISSLARTVETCLRKQCVSALVAAIVVIGTSGMAASTDAFAKANSAGVLAFASTSEQPATEADQKTSRKPGANPTPDKSETPDSEPEEKPVLILEGQVTNLIGAGIVDVAVTALAHLGVTLDPAWRLDGRVVGLRPQQGR